MSSKWNVSLEWDPICMVNFMFEKTVFVRENFTLHSKVSLDYIISLMPEKKFGKKAKKMKIRQVQKSLISALRNF